MSIFGIGTDIIEVQRIREARERDPEAFLSKILSTQEIEYCLSYLKTADVHIAGRFAAKEATAKALGVGFGKLLEFHDIEILRDEKGKPYIQLSAEAQKRFPALHFFLSISHTEHYATAMVLAAKDPI